MIQGDTSSFKKAAVLTGLTVLIGGAEISTADAATTLPETHSFFLSAFPGGTQTDALGFQQFNDALGTLTGVNFVLQSVIDIGNSNGPAANVTVNGGTGLFSQTSAGPFTGSTTVGSDPFFRGAGTFPVDLFLNPNCEGTCSGEGWSGSVTVSFNYETPPAQAAVPLPAALPLFASGAAGLGVLGWRNRRKQKAKKA